MSIFGSLRDTATNRARRVRLLAIGASLTVTILAANGQRPTPKITSTTPANGKRGDLIAFSGQNLGGALVGKVYLTDGEHDFQIVIAEQTSATLKVRIPQTIPSGRFAFMVLTADKDVKFIALPHLIITLDQSGTFRMEHEHHNKVVAGPIFMPLNWP